MPTNQFEIIGDLKEVETIASGQGVHIRDLLDRRHGRGRWRKMKGRALVRLATGKSMKRKSTGTKRTALAGSTSRSKPNNGRAFPRFVMCIDNRGNEASIDIGRIYRVIRPRPRDPEHYLRVIDNEGEDYLYYEKQFVDAQIAPKGRRVMTDTAYATL